MPFLTFFSRFPAKKVAHVLIGVRRVPTKKESSKSVHPFSRLGRTYKYTNTQIQKYTNTASVPIHPTYVIFLKSLWYEELEDNIYIYCIIAAIFLENICK